MNKNSSTIIPDPDTKIMFAAATAFVRKYVISKKPIQLTAAHKGSRITLDQGWIIIDQRWYSN